jgi:hypothetical protein
MQYRVDPLNNDSDREVLFLGAIGKSTRYIQERTGYSPHQIGYRLKKDEVKRADYRNGTSELSQRLERMNRHVFLVTVLRRLRKKYK